MEVSSVIISFEKPCLVTSLIYIYQYNSFCSRSSNFFHINQDFLSFDVKICSSISSNSANSVWNSIIFFLNSSCKLKPIL